MTRIGRSVTTVGSRVVIQELHNESDGIHFRADVPLLAETGAQLWLDGDELVVKHPGGTQTRHRGQLLADWYGDSRLSFAIGESENAVAPNAGQSAAPGVGIRTPELREFVGFIWIEDQPGIRLLVEAQTGDEAKAAVIAQYGEGHVVSIWNEDDARKFRGPR